LEVLLSGFCEKYCEGVCMTDGEKKTNKELTKSLVIAQNEKDVENAYRQAFNHYFPSTTSSPNKVDGMLQSDPYNFLMEFKHKSELKEKISQVIILTQVLFYLKKLEKKGTGFPCSIFVGDINECFCISVGSLFKYLSKNIDWSVSPSGAPNKFPELIKELLVDKEIYPFVFDINKNFSFLQVVDKMKAICDGKTFSITITPSNIVQVFTYFKDNVITERKALTENKEDKRIRRLVDVFMSCLTDKENTFLHPKKANVLSCRGELYKVNANLFSSFFSQFKQDYTVEELDLLTSCADRILEEIYRRRRGAFFTPKIWTDEAHKMITQVLGPNWYNEYVVWNPACGTANLTKDYTFKELFLSDIEQGYIDTINDMGYNKGATIFTYDFLNEVGIDGCPLELQEIFQTKKKVLILMNPPYGMASNWTKEKNKTGIAKNAVWYPMEKEKMYMACQQLYCHFIYKITKLREQYGNEVAIATFVPPIFLTSSGYKRFREYVGQFFHFNSGMIFSGSNFSDVAGNWPISFTIMKSGAEKNSEVKFTVKEIDEKIFEIKNLGNKMLYTADNNRASDWAKEKAEGLEKIDVPYMVNSINVNTNIDKKLCVNSLGYMVNGANNVDHNDKDVYITSLVSSTVGGFSIVDINFLESLSLFCARKTIHKNWLMGKTEYLKPTDEILNSEEYKQWNRDAIVFSLFNGSSQQSSLRQITYKNKKWNIFNHFFFMSNKEMLELANKAGFKEMYQDVKQFPEDRYVYKLLETVPLSDDAKRILEYARELVRKSIDIRQVFHEEDEKYHLQAWDAGWAQLKPMLKKFYLEELKTFGELYKKFAERLREGVYKFGFLR
jgi:hypothetical protein